MGQGITGTISLQPASPSKLCIYNFTEQSEIKYAVESALELESKIFGLILSSVICLAM